MILSRWNNYFLANLCFFVESIYAIGSGKGIENAKPLFCCARNTTTCNRNSTHFSLDLKFLLDGVSFTSSWAPVNMGVSENSVPLNPMVNDHYPY